MGLKALPGSPGLLTIFYFMHFSTKLISIPLWCYKAIAYKLQLPIDVVYIFHSWQFFHVINLSFGSDTK